MTKNVENMLTWLKDNGALVDDIILNSIRKNAVFSRINLLTLVIFL